MTSHEGSDDRAVNLEPRDDEEPLCSETEFAAEMRELVASEAPQVFALVEEIGERADGRIIAWGMTFDDGVEVVGVNGRPHLSLHSPERAQWAFSRHRKIRLVWTSPATTRRPEQVTAGTP